MHTLTVLLQHVGPQHGGHYGPMGGAGGLGGGLHLGPWWILLSLVVLVAAVSLVRLVLRDRDSMASPDPIRTQDKAVDTLRQRYATGDIDDEEFEERRARLSGTRRS